MERYMEKAPVRVVELKSADTSNPMLRIQYVDQSETADSPNDYATITIDNNGDSNTNKLMVTVKIGPKNAGNTALNAAATTTYEFAVNGTVVTSGGTFHAVTNLGDLVKHLNAIPGIKACRLHAPADYSLDSNDFVDLAETRLGFLPLECLYKDSSEVKTICYRLGVPDDVCIGLGHGKLALEFVRGFVNSDSDTDCVLKISEDPDEYDATKEKELPFTRYIPDNAWTELFDLHENPPILQGPILIEATASTTMTNLTSQVLVGYRHVEL